jgi:hypothetical protein
MVVSGGAPGGRICRRDVASTKAFSTPHKTAVLQIRRDAGRTDAVTGNLRRNARGSRPSAVESDPSENELAAVAARASPDHPDDLANAATSSGVSFTHRGRVSAIASSVAF